MGILDRLNQLLDKVSESPKPAPRGTAQMLESNRRVTGEANTGMGLGGTLMEQVRGVDYMGHVAPEDLKAALALIEAGTAAAGDGAQG